jgi:predicted nucleic acid-binding protein
MERIFVDTDVCLDLLTGRQPHNIFAAQLFSLADLKQLELCVSSLAFSNLNYILSRQYSQAESRKILLKFRTLVTVLAVSEKTVESALLSDFKDLEDGLQHQTALEFGIETIITRNLKDYKRADTVVMTAEQYLFARNS